MSQAIPQSGRAPQVVYGTTTYIPEWQTPLTADDLARPVLQNGEELGFVLGDVMPSRQWAVNQKNGELLEQRDFERLYEVYATRHVPVGSNEVVDIRRGNRLFDPKIVPVPTVRNFVSRGLDWQGKEVSIGYDPDKLPDAREGDIKVYDSRGEEVTGSRDSRPIDITKQLEVLTALRERGRLTDVEYAQEVAALATGDALAPRVEDVPVGFEPMGITVEAASAELTARCGKVCGSKAGRGAHERHCDKCNPKEESTDGQEQEEG